MFRRFASRPWHYALLMAAHGLMTLPNLGAHTLWDMDEGVNAEAAREMLESGNWITPYYNYEIRTAKPVLLYWLQATAYLVFGVNEFAARFPAAVCGLGTVLLTYELGRRLFSRSTGLLAGLALGSCIEFCIISHAATPDAPLLFFTTLTFYLYWRGSENGGRWWFAPAGAAAGLAMLTKGPVGFVLPAGVIGLHLWVTGSLGRLWDRRALSALGSFFLTAGPWYALVAVETRGKWAETFFLRENIGRFSTPMDSHGGGPYYHILTLILLFAPWSIFFAITLWHAYKEARKPLAVPTSVMSSENGNAYRFLLCWFGVYLVIFSAAATKLPNYIVPLYPALAILTARLVDRWRTSAVTLPRWAIPAATGGLGVVGAVTGAALLILGGAIALPGQSHRPLPAVSPWAALGIIPLATAMAFALAVARGRRTVSVGVLAAGAVLFMGGFAAFPPVAMNEYKVPAAFATHFGLDLSDQEVRIGTVRWLRHSTVFYVRREVTRIEDAKQADDFLAMKKPGYLLVPEAVWLEMAPAVTAPHTIAGRHFDFYARGDILIVSNVETEEVKGTPTAPSGSIEVRPPIEVPATPASLVKDRK